ncbi:hypothetical protein BDN70DRAFT_775361, partial [Pholiota conissans]
TKSLELVHSDLHGLLPVSTAEGYYYWMTFINNCTSLRVIMHLKKKAYAFNAFRTF